MGTQHVVWLWIVVCAGCAGCAGSAPGKDAGAQPDAGAPPDAGADAGVDAGQLDAGAPDSGGPAADAGADAGAAGGPPIALGGACPLGQTSDPCEVGLVCSCGSSVCGVDSIEVPGTCQVPGEFYPCSADAGCAPGLDCVGASPAGVCLYPCVATRDCRNPLATCQAFGLDAGSFCNVETTSCSPGSGVCGDADAGTCIPLAVTPTAAFFACLQGGPLPAGAACSPSRAADGGTAELCSDGWCLTGDAGNVCAPLCDAFGVLGSCQSSQLCFNGGIAVSFGVCLQVCGGDAGTDCPSPTLCQQVDAVHFACIP